MFLEISQNSQEKTCARVSFLKKLQVQKVISIDKILKLQNIDSKKAAQQGSQTSLFQKLSLMDLTHFMPLISSDTPRKHQKTRGFLMFSGDIKRDQWHEMG